MIEISVDTRRAVVTNKEILTSGSAGIQVQFTLSEDWTGLSKLAVFRTGEDGESIDVVLDNNLNCVVPAEALQTADEVLFIGVYGSDGNGTVIIPTIWAAAGVIRPGTEPNTPAEAEPTPEIWAQILSVAQEAETTATGAMNYVEQAVSDLGTLEDRVSDNEEDRVAAEQARASAEDTRAEAETARITNEDSRINAESNRNTAEVARSMAETARADAEAARVTAEQGRVTAENARVAAEAIREEKYAEYVETVSGYADDAEASAEAARASMINAQTASGSASQSATSANNSATTATSKANEASSWASTALNAAGNAAGSQSAAAQSATAAAASQTAAETAQAAAEAAQSAAEDAQDAAEAAQTAAETAASSISGKSEQIDQNTSDISDLSRQLSDVEENQIPELKSALTNQMTLKESKNHSVSDSSWTSGYYISNVNNERGGTPFESSTYSYSDYIPVEEGDIVRLWDLYGGTFEQRQMYTVTAYDTNKAYVYKDDAVSWKPTNYTVQSGIAFVRISTKTATNYMVTINNDTVTAYEPYHEPYYIATYDFVKDAIGSGDITAQNIKNGFACALPKTKFRQTVGIPCTWYKSSMVTPSSIYAYVNAGYSLTTNGDETFSYNTSNADATNNGYVWYEYDPFMNLLYKFDNNTGYGAPTVVKALNLSDCSLLAIGDSTVDHDTMTAKLLSYFTENGHTITLLGTLGSQSDPLNKNEGRAGWTTANYLANTTKNGYTNPFWNPTAEKFDFSYYMAQQGYSGVDFVVIQLGINDLYPTDPRGISTPNYSAIWANIRTMIDSIHEYNTATKIIINLPTTPNSNPEAHLTSEAIYQNFVINYNEYALNAMLSISKNYVRASYCHLILDPATEIRDNVHPTVAGYEKMALEVINQINCWQNGV